MARRTDTSRKVIIDAPFMIALSIGLALMFLIAYAQMRAMLFLLASGLGAMIFMGLVMPGLNTRHKRIHRTFATEIVAGEVVQMTVTVENGSWLPAFALGITEHAAFLKTPLALGLIGLLPGRGSVVFETGLLCAKRGRWQLGPARIESGFPLGLLTVSTLCEEETSSICVLPRIAPIHALPLTGSSLEVRHAELPSRKGYGHDQVIGVRTYREGDPLKHIHWKLSAQRGTLLVREFEPQTAARLHLVLDLAASRDEASGPWTSQEAQIAVAASIACHALDNNIPFSITWASSHTTSADQFSDRHAVLTWFADLQRAAPERYADTLRAATTQTHAGESVFIFPASDDQDAYQAAQLLQATCGHVVALVFDAPSFQGENTLAPEFSWPEAACTRRITAQHTIEGICHGLA